MGKKASLRSVLLIDVPGLVEILGTALEEVNVRAIQYFAMHVNPLIWPALAVIFYYVIWGRKGNASKAVMAAYRAGDYTLALQKTEGLKDGASKTAAYYFFRGTMLHKLGQLSEAEPAYEQGYLSNQTAS
jgi:hypothetical protein